MHWKLFIFHRITWEKFSYIRLLLLVNFSLPLPPNRRLLPLALKTRWNIRTRNSQTLVTCAAAFSASPPEKKEEEEQEQKLKRKRRKIKISQGVKLKKFFNESRWSCSCSSSLWLFAQPLISSVCVSFQNFSHGKNFLPVSSIWLYWNWKGSRRVKGLLRRVLSFHRNFVLELSTQSVSLDISISNITFMPSLARCRQDWLDCQLREMTENSKTKIFAVVVGCSRKQKETSFEFETKWNLLQVEWYFVNNSVENLVKRLNEWKMIIALKSSMKIS